MALRGNFPKARLSESHFFLTLARGEKMRCFAMRPWAVYGLVGLFPIFGLMYFAASLVYVMRDDVIASMFQRQQLMQQAYEDRLASLRAQLDQVSSRQLLDQNSLEGKMHELISRQARLESRAAVVAALARTVGGKIATTETPPLPVPRPASLGGDRRDQRAAAPAQSAGQRQDNLPVGTTSYAATGHALPPALSALGSVMKGRPRPHAVELLPGKGEASAPQSQKTSRLLDPFATKVAADRKLPVELRLGALTQSLDRIEIEQLRKVELVKVSARKKASRLRKVIAKTGLSADRLKLPPQARRNLGGPFVPYKYDPNAPAFERAVYRLQQHALEADRLRRIIRHIPIQRPLPDSAGVSSNFGRRVDPFNGRLATHTGVDFRERHGTPVHASAAGRITKAGYNGGYGKMVEIDHGNGITSRYAHLSAISVSSGQWIPAGKRVGKIGSTGRSTGPHLHYEVRINDAPVNPMRFLRAGAAL